MASLKLLQAAAQLILARGLGPRLRGDERAGLWKNESSIRSFPRMRESSLFAK
jgi:hypothetical protein